MTSFLTSFLTTFLLTMTMFPMVSGSHQLQCTDPSHVGRYFYDVCELRCECTQPSPGLFDVKCFREREDFTCMDDARRYRFVQTYLAVSNSTHPLYGQLQYLIAKHEIGFNTIHITRWFLPWHRAYMLELENLLRHVDCRVTIPYWPYSDRPTDPFPYLPFGENNNGLGDDGDLNNSGCVVNGPFAFPWIPPSRTTCLTRNFRRPPVLPTLTQLNQILTTPATSYGSFSDQIQYSYHNGVHVTVGGDLATAHSTVDLLFFLLHGNVDRAWDTWQKQSSSKLNAYGGYSSVAAMPYMFGTITFNDIKSLEVSGIRYVKMQSDPLGLNHTGSPVCSSILLASGWFSASVIETQILTAPLSLLATVPQTAPVTLSPAQQETWLESMSDDMKPAMRILLKQSEDQTNALKRMLTNIIDPNNWTEDGSTSLINSLDQNDDDQNETDESLNTNETIVDQPTTGLTDNQPPRFHGKSNLNGKSNSKLGSGEKSRHHPRIGMDLNDFVDRIGLAPECPPTADRCDIDPRAQPKFRPPRTLTNQPMGKSQSTKGPTRLRRLR